MKLASPRDKTRRKGLPHPIPPSPPPQELKERYDYVVVGAGSAGCVVANRLSEDPAVEVLLLEAGVEDTDQRIHIPRDFEELQGTDLDWQYVVKVEDEPVLKPNPGRPFVPWPKGRVVGGSSAINALVYIRGNRRDYDHWVTLGNEGWGYDDVLPYFKASEHNLSKQVSDEYHGRTGPLVISDIVAPNPATDAFVKAAREIHDACHDFNDSEQTGGAGYYQVTIDRDGKRSSAGTAFLNPEVRRRPNLTIATRVQATRLLFEGRKPFVDLRAVGVEFADPIAASAQSVRVTREVIVCAGTVESPKLLMLSGVGPKADLQALKIDVVHDLPGVGQNLQDHPIAPVLYLYKPGKASAPSTSGGVEGGLFLDTREDSQWPDLQFHFTHKILGRPQPPAPPAENGYMIVATLVRPNSRGYLKLKSNQPSDPPEIHPNYLSDPADVQTLVAGLKIGRQIGERKVFDKFRQVEAAPGAAADTDEKLAGFISMSAIGLYHPVGTCKMGPANDPQAVVDSKLRVHGIEGLRVVDASIMPTITTGNTNAPTIMIAEKAATMIKEEAPRQPSGKKVVKIENTAQAFLHLLSDLGVKHIFGVPGSDVTSLLDAFAKSAAAHEQLRGIPTLMQVPHETCAMNMAAAHYLATGAPQVVLVHSTVGTGNTLCSLINDSRAQIPLVLLAGRTPVTEQGRQGSRDLVIQWAQESFDQGGMVREFVKWDYELRTFDQLEAVVRRAFAIAMTEPRGPVYLTLPRELMAERHDEFTIAGTGRDGERLYTPVVAPAPNPIAIEEAAQRLASAKSPLIITRSFGRRPENVAALVALAESGAIPVVEYQIAEFMNFPSNHELHLGYEYDQPPNPATVAGDKLTTEALSQADVILVIDCPMPWAPSLQKVKEDAFVIHVGADPIYERYPVWSFPAHLAIAGDPLLTVKQLAAALQKFGSENESTIKERRKRVGEQHRKQREAWSRAASEAGKGKKPNFAWISHCVKELLASDADRKNTVVIQEYDLQLPFTGFTEPGSYFGFSPSGGLGFGVGGALGLKLGWREKTIISVVGDGTYLLGAPDAAHVVSAIHDLPVLWVICNNGGWGYLALETVLIDGAQPGLFPMLSFPKPPGQSGPWPAYETLVEAFGGKGLAVSRPKDLPQALREGLRYVRDSGRQFLINVDCDAFPLSAG
ncbi:MAG TPA: thiamine pyrophosphate-requiring protein [Pyrinomonadaceae bacterium]|nr:thiamine pyrophosphate-requiring protein [Pyrinomonadaceae bacterium]